MSALTQKTHAQRVYSYIDLRRFAAERRPEEQAPAEPGGAEDFFAARRTLDLAPGPVEVGSLHVKPTQDGVATAATDEFLIVLDGVIEVVSDGRALTLSADQSMVLPKGTRFSWSSPGATLLFMRYKTDRLTSDKPVLIDHGAVLAPSNPPLAALLVGPTPSCRNHNDYKSSDGQFVCGVWDSTPYHRQAMTYRHYELMHLLEGSVTFEDETGRRETFKQGAIFLAEQGATCSWLSEVHVKKVFAIYRPA